MNKKYIAFGIVGILALMVVSAAIITYYGQINQTVNVQQAVVLTCPDDNCDETITGFSGDTLMSKVYTLDNNADSSREVELVSTKTGIAPTEVTTSYLKEIEYIYSKTWPQNGDVLVEVKDTNDGWLQWTYTAITPATSGKLKMTVEINNPTGFGITTFDDGSHDGWYYYDTEGIVRISNYDGSNKVSGYEFVETNINADNLVVRIKKSSLPNTFKWQGFANFHLASNWIELDKSGSPWVPTGVGIIRENLPSTFTMEQESGFDFVIVNKITDFSSGIVGGIITTEAQPNVA